MAFCFCDGFDAYSAAADMTQKWNTIPGSGLAVGAAYGRFGGWGIQFTSSTSNKIVSRTFKPPAAARGGTSNAVHVAYHFRFAGASVTVNSTVLWMQASGASGGDDGAGLQFRTDGRFQATLFSSAGGSGTGQIVGVNNYGDDQWHHLEYKFIADNSAGRMVLKIDGVTEIDFSGDTWSDGSLATNGIDFVSLQAVSGRTIHYDDVVVWDEEGSGLTAETLGAHRIETLHPDANGTTNDFTPSAGDNYECVDDHPADDDVTYVEDGTTGHKDLYGFGAMATSPLDINGVVVNLRLKNPDVGTVSMKARALSNGSGADGGTRAITSAYLTYQELFAVDPDTAAAWLKSAVNAAEFGLEVA